MALASLNLESMLLRVAAAAEVAAAFDDDVVVVVMVADVVAVRGGCKGREVVEG